MTIISMASHASVKMRIPARETPVWSLFLNVGMAESISDTHEHICAGWAPAGQTSILVHHRQWPEAQIDLRDLPRATRGSLRQLVGRASPPSESRQGPASPPGPSPLLLREWKIITNEMPVSLAPGTIPTYNHTFSYANRHTTQFRRNASEPWKEVLTLRRLIIFYPEELLFPYNLGFKPVISAWTEFQKKLTWCSKSSPV